MDRALIARMCAGDDAALAAVYDQHSSLLYGIATRLVGASDAVDVCQEAFLSLWQRPEAFDADRGSLGTYLATITRRRCLDLLRSDSRRRGREERSGRADRAAEPAVDERAMASLTAAKVRAALDTLPEDQRRAIELAYLEGLTFRGVAEAMGSPEGTAKSRLRLGLARLSRELADWRENDPEPIGSDETRGDAR